MPTKERRFVEVNLNKVHSNQLPDNASVVGFDLDTGNQIYFNTSSLSWQPQPIYGDSSGSYTPVLSFQTPGTTSHTYSSQTGRYYKIGKHVTVNFAVALSSLNGAAGSVSLTGLPFTSETSSDGAGFGMVPVYQNMNNGTNKVSSIRIHVRSNSTVADLYHSSGGEANVPPLDAINLTDTTQLTGSFYYIAAQ